jgi:hypothetical protein
LHSFLFDYLFNYCATATTKCGLAWTKNILKGVAGIAGVWGGTAACATGAGCVLGAPTVVLSSANVAESIDWLRAGDEKTEGTNVIKQGAAKLIPSASQQQINDAYSLAEVAAAGALLTAPTKVYERIWTVWGVEKTTNYSVRPLSVTSGAAGEAAGAVWDAWGPVRDRVGK